MKRSIVLAATLGLSWLCAWSCGGRAELGGSGSPERQCEQFEQQYADAVDDAKQCTAATGSSACEVFVPVALSPCPACNTFIAEDSELGARLADLADDYERFGCKDSAGVDCPAIACLDPAGASCVDGVCQDQ
jgi:hypothetical protein